MNCMHCTVCMHVLFLHGRLSPVGECWLLAILLIGVCVFIVMGNEVIMVFS